MVYEACPFQYYVTAILGIPPPITRGMKRGVSVHKLIADHFRRRELTLPDGEPDVRRMVERFRQSRFNLPAVATEKPFTLQLPRGRVRGRIDVILPRGEDGLEIVDFKSGRAGDRDDLATHLQLPLYALATASLYDRSPPDLSYTYYFLAIGKEVSFQATEQTAREITGRVDRLMEAIQSGQFAPPPGCTCFACSRMEEGRLWLPRNEGQLPRGT